MTMNFVGNGQRLTDADYAAAARSLGLRTATIKGVVDVEASGRGFDSVNRPKILTEPHVFYRELGPGSKRTDAIGRGVAYPHWGMKPYPRTSDANYARLSVMCSIDETAALRSTSWGLFQIMGFNHNDCGFKSPQEMVEAFKQGEDDQLVAFIRIVQDWGLVDELERRDAEGFAKRYNGPGYAKNRYPAKLRSAWAVRDRETIRPGLAPVGPPAIVHDDAPAAAREPPSETREERPKPPPVISPAGQVAGVGAAAAAGAAAVASSWSGSAWPWVVGIVVVVVATVAVYFWARRKP